MQVKIFTRSNPNAQRGMRDIELEHEINRWLADKPTIEILNVAQSSATRGETQELIISLWYRTPDEVARTKLQRGGAQAAVNSLAAPAPSDWHST